MPDPFLCIMSCKRDQENGCVDWFRKIHSNLLIPYRIFLGQGCVVTHEDEIVLSVDDSYARLPWKVQTAFKWVFDQAEQFTHIIKTDSDCRIWSDRLLTSDFEKYDYVGNFFDGHVNPASRSETYASGAGYCLSRTAAEKVTMLNVEQIIQPCHIWTDDKAYAEDEFVGRCLPPSEWRRFHSEQYMPNFQGRSYNGTTDNLIVLGNVFDNKAIPFNGQTDQQTSLNIWAAETQAKREGRN